LKNEQAPERPVSIIEKRNIIIDENYQKPEALLSVNNVVVRNDGLFETDHNGDETRICDPIWHLGNAVRTDGRDASDIVEFLDRTGAKQETIIPHIDAVNRPGKVFDVLAYHNGTPGERTR